MTRAPAEAYLPGQRRILVLSWLAYLLAYTLRLNFSVVIPALVAARHYTYAQMGLVTSLYFVFYMFGQLINGYLGDHVSSRRLVVCGLAVSALCNLGLIFAPSLAVIIVCWSLNGLAQSMLWAPLMRTLSLWFDCRRLGQVSFLMSLTAIFGYFLSWGSSSLLINHLGWQAVFYLPAGLALLFTVILGLQFQNQPPEATIPIAADGGACELPEKKGGDRLPVRSYFRIIRLPSLLLLAMLQGLIREGIGVWFPTILQSSSRYAAASSWLVLAAVPIINLGGILLVRNLNRRLGGDSNRTILQVFILTAGFALFMILLPAQGFWLILLAMILMLALSSGLTPVLTSVIPFQYARFGRVALTAGILDFAIYCGAAVTSLASGLIADRYEWNGVMILWLAAAVAGLLLALRRKLQNPDQARQEQALQD